MEPQISEQPNSALDPCITSYPSFFHPTQVFVSSVTSAASLLRLIRSAWLIYDLLFFVLWIIPFDIIVFIFKKLSVLYVKSHYLEFEEETDEEIEQDIADDPEDHNDNIPYAEESDFEDDTIYTEERKPIPKIIPKKKKAPFNVEAFAKECNAYVVKQERQEEQENLQH